MRILNKTKDGGPESPVDAFFLCEFKGFFSVALLRFNKGGRENYHTHAFNAWTWFIKGDLEEQVHKGGSRKYKRSLLPKKTPRKCNHRVVAKETSWCFTIRGPWEDQWTETTPKGVDITLTHGRKIVERKGQHESTFFRCRWGLE
jgi:hypothetical protein